MKRENLPWIGLALLLLVGGWIVSQRALSAPSSGLEESEMFREWLWGTRSLDLAVQVGILFVGALGIAALLPSRDEALTGDETLLGDETPPAGDIANGDGILRGKRKAQ